MVKPVKINNYTELTKDIAARSDTPVTTVDRVLKGFVASVGETLSKNEAVAIRGFGTFQPSVRAATTYQTPVTKEPVDKPASIVPSFHASGAFKDMVAAHPENIPNE